MKVSEEFYIKEDELVFTFSRSGGPGGQNVNKVNSRVTLRFDVVNSKSLDDNQKQLILNRLANRINKDGVLQIVALEHRSQKENREAAVERLVALLQEALHQEKPRIVTKPTRAAKQDRLDEKKHRAKTKEKRAPKSLNKDSWDE